MYDDDYDDSPIPPRGQVGTEDRVQPRPFGYAVKVIVRFSPADVDADPDEHDDQMAIFHAWYHLTQVLAGSIDERGIDLRQEVAAIYAKVWGVDDSR